MASETGTRTIWECSLWSRPERILRSSLANAPRSSSIRTASDVYMYTSATVLHVRVVLRGVESGTCHAATWVALRGGEFAVAGGHGVPSSDLIHVADRGGGPLTQS
jgi:hypothetical protein